MSLRIILALAAMAAGLLAASPVHATDPGPNGRVTFARFDQALDDFDLFAANPDGTHEVQLTNVASESSDWSPDGGRIAFDFLDPNGDVQIGTLDPASPPTVTRLTSGSGFHGEPSWSPDGTRIAFDSDQGNHPAGEGIYTMRSLDGRDVVRVTENPYGWFDTEPAWSPDGRWISFARIRSVTPIRSGAGTAARADDLGALPRPPGRQRPSPAHALGDRRRIPRLVAGRDPAHGRGAGRPGRRPAAVGDERRRLGVARPCDRGPGQLPGLGNGA